MEDVKDKGENLEEERRLDRTYRVPEEGSQRQKDDDDDLVDVIPRDSEDKAKEHDRPTTPGRGLSVLTKGARKSQEPTSPRSTEEAQEEKPEDK